MLSVLSAIMCPCCDMTNNCKITETLELDYSWENCSGSLDVWKLGFLSG